MCYTDNSMAWQCSSKGEKNRPFRSNTCRLGILNLHFQLKCRSVILSRFALPNHPSRILKIQSPRTTDCTGCVSTSYTIFCRPWCGCSTYPMPILPVWRTLSVLPAATEGSSMHYKSSHRELIRVQWNQGWGQITIFWVKDQDKFIDLDLYSDLDHFQNRDLDLDLFKIDLILRSILDPFPVIILILIFSSLSSFWYFQWSFSH